MLVAIVACFGAGIILTPAAEDGTITLKLFGVSLPAICWFRLSTGLPCAGCGLTRSVVLLLHAEPGASFVAHPFGVVAVALALLQIPPRLAGALGSGGGWIARWDRLWALSTGVLMGLMFAWWAYSIGLPRLAHALFF